MKTLNYQQMESVQGGWSWRGCGMSAVMTTYAFMPWIGGMSAVGLGGVAMAGSLVAGCIMGGLA